MACRSNGFSDCQLLYIARIYAHVPMIGDDDLVNFTAFQQTQPFGMALKDDSSTMAIGDVPDSELHLFSTITMYRSSSNAC